MLRTVFGLNYDPQDSKFFLIDYNSKFWPCIVMTIYGFPASLFRTLGALRYTFLLGIFFVSFLTISVIIESTKIGNLNVNYFEKAKYFQISGFLTTFPIAIFSFTCHSNVLDVYQVNINKIISFQFSKKRNYKESQGGECRRCYLE